MTTIVLVGLGGFLGTILRFLIYQIKFSQVFPYSTIIVNMLGSFLIGFIISTPMLKNGSTYQFITIGLIGGFTTYSTFSAETLNLILKNEYLTAFAYILISVIGGIFFCSLGYFLKKQLW